MNDYPAFTVVPPIHRYSQEPAIGERFKPAARPLF